MMLTNEEVQEKRYREIIDAGADDLFQKPFPGEKILVHLKKGLRQRDLTSKESDRTRILSNQRKMVFPIGSNKRKAIGEKEKSLGH